MEITNLMEFLKYKIYFCIIIICDYDTNLNQILK